MSHASTLLMYSSAQFSHLFQSLKRDVSCFNTRKGWHEITAHVVSIAQTRCLMLQLRGFKAQPLSPTCFNRSNAMSHASTWLWYRLISRSRMFQSLKRDVSCFNVAAASAEYKAQEEFQSLKRDVSCFNMVTAIELLVLYTGFQSLKRDVSCFNLTNADDQATNKESFNRSNAMSHASTWRVGLSTPRSEGFNRSNAMSHASTWQPGGSRGRRGWFQSLKRDVSCFNRATALCISLRSQVSIAQTRCLMLQLRLGELGIVTRQGFNRSNAMSHASTATSGTGLVTAASFQSLKRDVSCFNHGQLLWAAYRVMFQSLKRDVSCFNFVHLKGEKMIQMFQSLKRDVSCFNLVAAVNGTTVNVFQSLKRDVSCFNFKPEYVKQFDGLFQSLKRDVSCFNPGLTNILEEYKLLFQSLKRDVSCFNRTRRPDCEGMMANGFNRSNAMSHASTHQSAASPCS